MEYLVLAILVVVGVIWIYGYLAINDFSVPTIKVEQGKFLFIFPHPDDEAMNCGGLLKQIEKIGGESVLVVLTLGEKGNPKGEVDLALKDIRKNEMENSAVNFGVSKLIQEDFGDGQLADKKEILEKYIRRLMEKEKPRAVVSYDRSGLYGHADHMEVSDIVTRLVRTEFKEVELWYACRPEKVMKMIKMPTEMAKDKNFSEKRSVPNCKIWTGAGVINKIRAVSIYRSQRKSFRSALPKIIPLWFAISMQLFEYYWIEDK